MNELKMEIVKCLIENGELTSYGINKILRKNVPGIEYALQGLVDSGVVISISEDKKTVYDVHPFFDNEEAIKEAGEEISKILTILEKSGGPLTLQGYIDMLKIIMEIGVHIQNSS